MTQDPLEKTLSDLSTMIAESQQESNKKNSILLSFGNCSPDPFWVVDLKGRYVHCNQRVCELFSLTEEEIIGHTICELVDYRPDVDIDTGVLQIQDEVVLEREDVCTFYVQGKIRGKPFMYLAKKSRWIGADGEVLGTVGTARDISEREVLGNKIYNKLCSFERKITDIKQAEEFANIISEYRSFIDRHKDLDGN